jgi:hypothetical protein
VLLLLGFVLLLFLDVGELAVVHHLAHGRHGRGGNHDEVEAEILRLADGNVGLKNLGDSVGEYDANFSGTDELIYVVLSGAPKGPKV